VTIINRGIILITLAQIKAARSLLSWTQDNLASAAGLSLPGINNLERGITSPRKETLLAIQTTMENAGIEFIDTTGVRLKTPDLSVQIIEGANWLEKYDEDIFSVLKTGADEILQFTCNNKLWMTYGSSTNHLYTEHRDKTHFKERILAPLDIEYITSPDSVYRTLPNHFFGKFDRQIYGDRVATILWDTRKIILIKSKSMANSEKLIFESLWETGKLFTPAHLARIEQWEGNKTKSK